ncbi:MAG: helix-turn-helix transcriptional regulator [Promethearchaeota archaeon]|nr:MAG: helix-turn-helix transcriptional regulator [Candidatus Lokiarchaeota archaeon]
MEVWEDIGNMKNCPIEIALNYLGKKWTLQIIRDLFKGKRRFSEFLKTNPQISTKMLSLRLSKLQEMDLIQKKVISTTPIKIEYTLTKKGKALNEILFQLAEFSIKNYPNEVYHEVPESTELDIMNLKKFFK